jgi:hypothetical protein
MIISPSGKQVYEYYDKANELGLMIVGDSPQDPYIPVGAWS